MIDQHTHFVSRSKHVPQPATALTPEADSILPATAQPARQVAHCRAVLVGSFQRYSDRAFTSTEAARHRATAASQTLPTCAKRRSFHALSPPLSTTAYSPQLSSRTGRGRPHLHAGKVRCVEKRGVGPAHPQRRYRFHPHQAPATRRGRGDQTGPRLCGMAEKPLRVTRLRTRSKRKKPRRALL